MPYLRLEPVQEDDEAGLFVADLYKMYEKVCLNNKWSFEIISISKSTAGRI